MKQKIKDWIWARWTAKLHGKKILWRKTIRICCDGGQPKWTWLPKWRQLYYDPYWGMYGFAIYLWGREINFIFGEDKNKLYA